MRPLRLWQRPLPFVAAIVTVSIVTGLAVWALMRPTPPRVTRTTMAPSSAAAAVSVEGTRRDVAITPDGTRVVYLGNSGAQLFVRAVDRLEATALSGLGRPSHPFLSPDGQWIGFFDGNTLKKVAMTGGPVVMLCPVRSGGPRGATWGVDGTIIFADQDTGSGLWRVSAAGGEPMMLTKPNRERGEGDHQWPEFLPGAQAVLFTITPATGSIDNARVAVLDLQSGTHKILVSGGSHAHYLASGHLVYGVGGTLRAVAFDLERLEAVGTPTPVLPQVVTTTVGAADFDVARDGTLVYVFSGGDQTTARSLVWVDRQGREEPIKAPVRAYMYPRLSPDGTRVALDVRDQEQDIWIWDLARETLTRFTFDPGPDTHPVWTPDGRRVLFRSARSGPANLFWQAADGTGAVERLTESPNRQFSGTFSPDGTRLVFREETATTGRDLMVVPLEGGRRGQPPLPGVGGPGRSATSEARPLVRTTFDEANGEISPDGRWLAYESDESGRDEIYVRPFPDVNSGRWQVSTGGGTRPLWARSSKELFYLGTSGAVMSTSVEGGSTLRAGNPTRLFEGRYFMPGQPGRTYDVSPDGRRFLMIKPLAGAEQTAALPSLIVVQNWHEELKRLVPTK
jgi:serine/threonine-protein kinase